VLSLHKLLAGATAVFLLAGIGIVGAFAQSADPSLTGDGGATVGSVSSSAIVTSQNLQRVCTLIDFEGLGNIQPVGTIGDATFSSAFALIDFDAGGTGNIANEPSPSTVLAPNFLSPFATVTLANPADEISFFYTSPFVGPSEVRVFNAANILLATIPLPQTPPGPGDPTGGQFGTWVQKTHNEASFVIKSLELVGGGVSDRTDYDDFVFCTENGVPPGQAIGGNIIPLDTTMVLAAGAQYTAAWMIPAIVSAIGIAIVIARKI